MSTFLMLNATLFSHKHRKNMAFVFIVIYLTYAFQVIQALDRHKGYVVKVGDMLIVF